MTNTFRCISNVSDDNIISFCMLKIPRLENKIRKKKKKRNKKDWVLMSLQIFLLRDSFNLHR